ncbi:hypothetical protein AVEN_130042-1 [Araneus ventricosus]|uniref:Uncharacterized protein n=2 Tax=Araneus ventricosus TaxID=182803 RepID=A0A4Y2RN65_ARAVE|nr:hypothetical protein AVEN_130042-1 [Araneus ventricosus]
MSCECPVSHLKDSGKRLKDSGKRLKQSGLWQWYIQGPEVLLEDADDRTMGNQDSIIRQRSHETRTSVGEVSLVPHRKRYNMEFSPSLSRASVKSVSSQYSVEELQEKIGELRKQHRENVGEFLKVQTMQRERMIQGLEEKLAARRDRRERKVEQIPPVSI